MPLEQFKNNTFIVLDKLCPDYIITLAFIEKNWTRLTVSTFLGPSMNAVIQIWTWTTLTMIWYWLQQRLRIWPWGHVSKHWWTSRGPARVRTIFNVSAKRINGARTSRDCIGGKMQVCSGRPVDSWYTGLAGKAYLCTQVQVGVHGRFAICATA